MKAIVKMLTTIVIRHENQHAIARQDTAFVLFVRTDAPDSLAKSTYILAQQWHETKAKTPEQLRHPMRVILFQRVIKVTMEKFEMMVASPSSRSTAVSLDWMSTDEQMVHGLKWDSEARKHVKDDQIKPLRISGSGNQRGPAGDPHGLRGTPGHSPIPCHPQTGTGVHQPEPHHDAGDQAQDRTGPSGMAKVEPVGEIGSMGSSRSLSTQRRHAEDSIGSTIGNHHGLMNLRLGNKGNHSYGNSIIRGFFAAAVANGGLNTMFKGGMLRFMEGLGIVYLWAQPFRAALTRDWERPSQQHGQSSSCSSWASCPSLQTQLWQHGRPECRMVTLTG